MYGRPHWRVTTSLVLVMYSRTTRSRGGGDSNRGHEEAVSLWTGAAASGSIGPRAQGRVGSDGGESFKTSGYLTETLPDPELGHAHAVNKALLSTKHTMSIIWGAWPPLIPFSKVRSCCVALQIII